MRAVTVTPTQAQEIAVPEDGFARWDLIFKLFARVGMKKGVLDGTIVFFDRTAMDQAWDNEAFLHWSA